MGWFPVLLQCFLSTGVPDAITPPTAAPAARNKNPKHKQVLVFEGRSSVVHKGDVSYPWAECFT